MIAYPNIDPVIVSFASVSIRWYGMMYIIGIFTAWLLGRYRIKHHIYNNLEIDQDKFIDLILYIALGLLIGGRLGYILFYQTATVISDPVSILKIWQGGMSFHGGLIGGMIGIYVFARRHNQKYFAVTDFIAPLVPPALFFGRIGNFINAELWGRQTDVAWAMIFPGGGAIPRHPSQLYEAFLEGIVLFIILWLYTNKRKGKSYPPLMAASGLFCLLYSGFRFFVEFYRMPDRHLGFIAFDWMSMGQLLCLPMILFGIILLILAYQKPKNLFKK